MNIIEAIKSGKKLKRRPWKKKWIDPKDTGYHITLTFQDLAANDWEVEEPKVTITRADFDRAYQDAVVNLPRNATTSVLISLMAAHLGLGD